jgi:predicted permease
MILGFFLAYKKLWPEQTPAVLSMIVVRVAAPCLALTSIVNNFDRSMLFDSLVLLLIAALHISILYIAGKGFAKLLKLNTKKEVIFKLMFSFANVIFIGLPVNEIIFGNACLPFLFVFYAVILALFWGFGANRIASVAHEKKTLTSKIINIFNPGFIAVLIGIPLACLGLHLPGVLDISLTYLSKLTVPLSLLFVGANLIFIAKGMPKLHLDDIFILLGKFVISPLLMFAMLKIAGVSGTAFGVFMLSSAMPCHMQTAILAGHYNVEPEYASRLIGLTTLASIVVIPVSIVIIRHFM